MSTLTKQEHAESCYALKAPDETGDEENRMDVLASYVILDQFWYLFQSVSLLSSDGQEVGSRDLQAGQPHLEKAVKTIVLAIISKHTKF